MDFELRISNQIDPADVERRSRWAEDLGFRTVWSSEAGHNPFLPLAYAVTATKRVELGTGIAVAFGRSPYDTAQSAWYLHRISGGRMILGLGTQVKAHIERRYGMPWYGAGNALAEYIECCREIWRAWREGVQPSFRGAHWQSTLSNPEFTPAPLPAGAGPIPVWISAVGPTLLRIAGRLADGVVFHAFSTPEYLRDTLHPALQESRSKAGVTTPLRGCCCVMAGVVHDEVQRREMRDHYRHIIAFYGSTQTYRPVLESIGFGELTPKLNELSRAKDWQGMEKLVPDELVDAMALIDEPAALGRRMRERWGGVLTQISIYRGGDRFMNDRDWAALLAAAGLPAKAAA